MLPANSGPWTSATSSSAGSMLSVQRMRRSANATCSARERPAASAAVVTMGTFPEWSTRVSDSTAYRVRCAVRRALQCVRPHHSCSASSGSPNAGSLLIGGRTSVRSATTSSATRTRRCVAPAHRMELVVPGRRDRVERCCRTGRPVSSGPMRLRGRRARRPAVLTPATAGSRRSCPDVSEMCRSVEHPCRAVRAVLLSTRSSPAPARVAAERPGDHSLTAPCVNPDTM